MIYVIYGAVGVIAVLLLLFGGAVIGWKARIAYEKHNQRVVQKELTEEELRQFKADQEAFSAIMNYNADIAYGNTKSLEELAREG